MAKDEYGLTPKQRAFCDYYIANHGNATQAAKDAGYNCKSDLAFRSQGTENLTKPNIVAYLDLVSKEAAAKRLVGKDEALEILSGIARGQKDPNSEDEVPYSVRAKAAELLLKVYGAFIDKVEISGNVGIAAELDEAWRRVKEHDKD
ncbi:Terminase small subunit [Anaerovibrio lipolyticus DSM 3074]|uniref:Terminase small subunit n=1 Tax=Anaerovibrio lipolyticus DSM 3074 TaxID=1120997 RepID=A0A1M6DZW9_9FIRM|nr:terminase small subunit [Anaerovibrio lipolyticus]SHI78797.1 Terminase small subunit [Anaerovibrio lipolyticus DSM 3074]